MAKEVKPALDALRALGTPAEIHALADQGYGPKSPLRANAHIHLPPNFSAFDTVDQAVALAADQNIGVLGISNYYDFNVYGEFVDRARARGIFPLFGLEIIAMQADLLDAGIRVNDPGNPGKTYLCGKGITRFADLSTEAQRLNDLIRHSDRERMTTMVERLRNLLQSRRFDTDIDDKHVVQMIVKRHGSPRETVYLQERHISQAFQEALFERIPASERLGRLPELLGAATKLSDPEDHVGLQNELRSHLMKAGKPAFVEESFLSFADARQLVLELGGIPSYPVLADGASPMCEFEADPDKLIDELRKREVHAVEWIPVRNKQSIVAEYVTKMRAAGLVVTAGTEHNTLDLIPFEPACKDGPLPPSVRDVFCEGACVVAAHQFLSLHGECGYVDRVGRPTAAYPSADARIKSLARIGAAVIGRYFDTCNAN
jgi:hypothetical protein